MKYHYVYIITNKINHKFYIGKHSTNNLDDGYMGSGIIINKAILKYNIKNFTKRILCFCNSEEEAYNVENFLVTDYLVTRDDCYNMTVGGKCGGTHKGHPHSEEAKRKIGNANTGKKRSEETKLKISFANKGLSKPSGMKGKHMSEKSKQLLSAAHTGKQCRKYKWLTQSGEIKEMYKTAVTRFHPNWVMIEQ